MTQMKKAAATLGLVAMGPIGYLLVLGQITAQDAAVRAGIVFAAVFLLRKAIAAFELSVQRSSEPS